MARILVVEDDTSLREILTIFLAKNAHDVVTASDGDAALRILAADDDDFDLVITDLKLGRRSGLDILTHVKASAPQT